ncbi:Uncharacterized protein HZ326_8942 [Fusarium oxysporum f. sp. albedinis]|nr:Uncharacterized protein HZ326_8942 [Fusarium oxysporum f. sp. albedinis]
MATRLPIEQGTLQSSHVCAVPCHTALRCAHVSRPGVGLVSDADADLDAMTERVMERAKRPSLAILSQPSITI